MAMEITVMRQTKVAVDRLRAECGVRYWEDATVNGVEDEAGDLIPLRVGDYWIPTIMLETGQILDWPEGTTASIHYKVCDDGRYYLLAPNGGIAAMIDGYVPKIMCPKDSGFSDYVIMDVGPDGRIADWHPDLSPWSTTPTGAGRGAV
jgi:hypothetical protein